MLGLLILLACLIAGHGLHSASPLPIPAAIFGMLILFVALLTLGKVPLPLQHTVTQLSPLLPLFLIPVSAGIVTQANIISEHGLQLAIILFISLIPGILVCGWLMKKGNGHD